MKQTFFAVEHLCARHGVGFALEDVSFAVERGTLAAVLGANGSGKTTLLRVICQQMKHRGICRLSVSRKAKEDSRGGKEKEPTELEKLSVRELSGLVSYIPQRNGIAVKIAALDVVLMGFNSSLGLLERPGRLQRQQAWEALAAFGLSDLAQRDYLTLSEGQKQLVMLARTLVERSQLLILDEPDSALDFPNRYGMMQKLADLVRGGERAAVLSLHDPALALRFADKLILMREGHCIGQLQPALDPVDAVEAALRQIFGPVTLRACEGRDGVRRLVLMWDGRE